MGVNVNLSSLRGKEGVAGRGRGEEERGVTKIVVVSYLQNIIYLK